MSTTLKKSNNDTINPSLIFIGEIETPYKTLDDCPRNISPDGPECRLHIYENYNEGLFGLTKGEKILILYWLNMAERTVNISIPRDNGTAKGTFALRTPVRPNPIGAAVLEISEIRGNTLIVKGLDCLNGTKLIDIKPSMDMNLPPKASRTSKGGL